ncbi:MAG TPA: 3-oxoacyl-ACP reductase family protein [Terriglobia bacterium]|nr:3-oxoacyl-ACP reductase family protein [Terriglobia bacterium]
MQRGDPMPNTRIPRRPRPIEEHDDRPLRDHVALVTGAGRRIGRVIALSLARAGAHVVVNYSRSRTGARETMGEILALGVDALALRADVSKPAEVRAMFRAVERRFRRLDVLVNNAGVFFPASWDKLSERDWDRVLGINLKGPFFCAQAAARLMMKSGGGRIINISSLGGLRAWPGYLHYCSSKAGQIMLTRCLAKALGPSIMVNSVAPGTILFPGEKPSPGQRRSIPLTPMQKSGRPEDVAAAVLFLATSAEFITGQVIPVDGGQSIL